MSEKPISVSSERAISMPIINLIGIIIVVASAVFGYSGLTNRITALETSTALILNDIELINEHIDTIPVTEIDSQLKEAFLLIEFMSGRLESLQSNSETQLPLMGKEKIQENFFLKRVK